jgi:hypothetical protein
MVTPTFSIPGCALWLDAADSSTLTGTTTVSEWRDKSGNGNHGTGRSGNGTTVSTTGGPNYASSTNGITFDANQFFITSSLKINTQVHCLIAVHNPTITNGNSTGNTRIFSFQNTGTLVVFPYMQGTTPRGYIGNATGAPAYNNSTLVERSVAGQKNLIIANIAPTSQSIYKNGFLETSGTSSIGGASTDVLTIGKQYRSSFNDCYEGYQGTIHELIIFNQTLTPPQLQMIEGYLSQKWNIPLSYSVPSPVPVFSPFPLPIISTTTTNQPSVFFGKGSQMISTLTSRLGAPTIPGCVLWLDAADASTITGTTTVSEWRDKSGNGNTLSQTTSSQQPTIVANVVGALPVVRFTGTSTSSTSLQRSTFTSLGTQGITFILVERNMTDPGLAGAAPFSFGATGSPNSGIVYQNNGGLQPFAGIAFNSSTPRIHIYYRPNTSGSGTATGYENGTSVVIVDTTTGTYSTTFAVGLRLAGSLPMSGDICEIIFFNTALTTSQRQQIEGYLATKWGLRDKLHTTHPYSSVPYTGPFTLNPTTPVSKSFVAVYQCPTVASAMNIGIGSNMDSSAFGLCQSNTFLYSPYQYVVGDISFNVPSYTGMNYTFASFNASANSITGIPGFNDLSTAAVAFQNKAVNTPFYIGSSTTLYTSSGFHLCEFIATSNALSSTDRQSVEGYLASKWGLLDQLPFSHPYKNFQPSGDQWIPPTLPTTILGLVSWLDMTYPGQTTASIADRVGGSFTVNVGTGNQFQLSNINNLPSLYFPGNSSNYLSKPSLPSTSEGSVLFVFNIADTRSDLPILTWRASTGTAPWGPLLTYTAGTTLKLQNNYAGATGSDTTPLTLAMTSGTNLVFFAWDYSNFYLSVNGGIPVVGSNAIPGSATTMYIGANTTTGSTPIMNFGELVVYNQYFEKSERQLLEGYLAWKWALQGTLPPNHPFSKISPTGATVVDTDALNTPAQIASLTTWLDAADSDTILQSSSKVTQWYDKSATSDIFLGTPASAPTYSNTNGPYLPGVYFSGQNALRGTVSAAIASGVGTCFMLATISGNNAQVFTGDYVTTTTPAVGKSFGLMCVDKNVTCPLQSDARVNRNPLPGVLSTTTSILYSQMNAAITSKIGVGSYGFGTPTNVVSTVNGQSVSWQPSVPSSSPWNLGYIGTNPALQNFYLHEFLCFSEYFTESQRFVVEGYLAWKWRIQGQLPVGHPYKSVRPVDAPFSPNLVAGMRWWVDGADTTSMTFSSGSNITQWRDKSGNGYHATGVNSPQKLPSGGVSFNAASSQTFSMDVPYSKTNTMFMVASPVPSLTSSMYYMDTQTGNSGNIYIGGFNNSYLIHYNGLNEPGFAYFTSGTAIPTSPFLVCSVKTTNVSSVGFYNGTQAFSIADNNLDSAGFWKRLGGALANVNYLTANIYEMIIFNTPLTGYQRQQIEGYLAWKWGLQSSLPPTHLFKNAIPTRSTNFMPTSLAGIALWLDAADASTIVGTASLVNEWKDKSGNGLNATKNTDVAPTYSSTGFNNGLPGVLFNGSTTRLHTPSISPTPVLSSNGTDTTIFAVVNWVGGVNAIALGLDTTGNTFAFYVPWTYPSTVNGNIFADLGSGARIGYDTVFAPASAPYVFSVTRSGVNGSIYVNGYIHASSTTLAGTIGTTIQTLGIGGTATATVVFNSYIAEILIYNRALTTAERQKVEGYLAWKWRRQNTLDTTHPYSKFAP